MSFRVFTPKPIPEKGYIRANFVIRQSRFHPEVRYLHLKGKSWVDAYIVGGYGSFVALSPWLRKNTDHDQRQKLISMLAFGTLGEVEVRLWPMAFPKIYGSARSRPLVMVTIPTLEENPLEPQTIAS